MIITKNYYQRYSAITQPWILLLSLLTTKTFSWNSKTKNSPKKTSFSTKRSNYLNNKWLKWPSAKPKLKPHRKKMLSIKIALMVIMIMMFFLFDIANFLFIKCTFPSCLFISGISILGLTNFLQMNNNFI